MATSDPMVRAVAIEAQYYALLRRLNKKGILNNEDAMQMAIDAQNSVAGLSRADEVIEEIRVMTGVRPIEPGAKPKR